MKRNMKRRIIIIAYSRQQCALHVFEQFGAMYILSSKMTFKREYLNLESC